MKLSPLPCMGWTSEGESIISNQEIPSSSYKWHNAVAYWSTNGILEIVYLGGPIPSNIPAQFVSDDPVMKRIVRPVIVTSY